MSRGVLPHLKDNECEVPSIEKIEECKNTSSSRHALAIGAEVNVLTLSSGFESEIDPNDVSY